MSFGHDHDHDDEPDAPDVGVDEGERCYRDGCLGVIVYTIVGASLLPGGHTEHMGCACDLCGFVTYSEYE